MCGEYKGVVTPSATSMGTPPHVWGIPMSHFGLHGSKGNTPTCVGNILPVSLCTTVTWEHPHMCGGYT